MSFATHQEAERLKTRVLIAVAAAGVFLTVAASAVPAWWLQARGLLHLDAPTRASRAPEAPRSIHIVNQTLIEDDEVQEWPARSVQARHLARFGWVDRETGLAHIPIERAMELVLRRHQRAPAGGEE